MKQVTSIAIILFLFFMFFPNNLLAYWNYEEMINNIEKKIPIAKKQAEALIKIMNSEKHMSEIQKDINKLKQSYTEFESKDAFLYKVFNKYDINLEKTAISKKSLLKPVHNTGSNKKYAQILSPDLLVRLTLGSPKNNNTTDSKIANPELFNNKDVQNLLSLCNTILNLQRPVQLLAREKININDLKNSHVLSMTARQKQFSMYGGEKLTNSRSTADNVYRFLVPNTSEKTLSLVFSDKSFQYKDHPISYLKFLQKLINYLDEIEYKPSMGNWAEFDSKIDKILADKAKMEDIDEIMKNDKNDTKNKDTNADDLQLPE
ncbi:MAG: hypothetical protein K9L78_04205 [Victivallales bacterium]|nr:hypothetical protein [Victivallales bacterium]